MSALGLSAAMFGARLLPAVADALGSRMPALWVTLSLGYVGVGAGVALHLARRGHSLGTVGSALVCWPLLVGLLGQRPSQSARAQIERELRTRRPPSRPGSHAARIDETLDALREALRDDALRKGTMLLEPRQLERLSDTLHQADRRLARINHLLTEAEAQERASHGAIGVPETDPANTTVADAHRALSGALGDLRQARDSSYAELEAVLSGLLSLRLQLGLFTLAGDATPVRERLADLEARVAGLAELSSMDLHREIEGAP